MMDKATNNTPSPSTSKISSSSGLVSNIQESPLHAPSFKPQVSRKSPPKKRNSDVDFEFGNDDDTLSALLSAAFSADAQVEAED